MREAPIKDPTVLSAFSGVGGLDLGLEAAGFRSVGCIEIDATACRSLKANRSGQWQILGPSDIRAVAQTLRPADLGLEGGELTLLAGAPPCQPFSKAAMWAPGAWSGLADERAQPLFAFLDLIDYFLPRAILLENVDGFLRGKHSAAPLITRALEEINARHGTSYSLDGRTIDAADYGVPQHRRRGDREHRDHLGRGEVGPEGLERGRVELPKRRPQAVHVALALPDEALMGASMYRSGTQAVGTLAELSVPM